MSEDDPADIHMSTDDLVATLCRGVAHPHRMAILRGINQNYALTRVATVLNLSRSGVQTHVDTLVDTDLVVRTGDQQDPYHVTVLGELALHLVEHVQNSVEVIEDARQTAAAQANDELGETPLPDVERDRAIHRRTWELVDDAIDDADLKF
ncbi:hypothetical protein NGM10_02010 [Halorussus salilacus]|uniref:hypothetical protein n=1 Tax=Halorussus salilacus TaxID=2953750 RepID=UPI0020A01D43|nr:hypothetical protein [Halorussus salilacus]USZ68526.1 hypothetical protein NGM10_02010 [Halorussus salilacus]